MTEKYIKCDMCQEYYSDNSPYHSYYGRTLCRDCMIDIVIDHIEDNHFLKIVPGVLVAEAKAKINNMKREDLKKYHVLQSILKDPEKLKELERLGVNEFLSNNGLAFKTDTQRDLTCAELKALKSVIKDGKVIL